MGVFHKWAVCVMNASPCERRRSPSLLTARFLSPHLLFPLFQVFAAVVRCKSPVLVGNLARIFLPTNPLCTKWRARGQVVCLLLIKPFDQSPFSSAHVALWAPPVCSVRRRTLLPAEMKPEKCWAFCGLWSSSDTLVISLWYSGRKDRLYKEKKKKNPKRNL